MRTIIYISVDYIVSDSCFERDSDTSETVIATHIHVFMATTSRVLLTAHCQRGSDTLPIMRKPNTIMSLLVLRMLPTMTHETPT
jgi:hypothetical protein